MRAGMQKNSSSQSFINWSNKNKEDRAANGSIQVIFDNGKVEIEHSNKWFSFLKDPYHMAFTVSNWGLILFFTVVYYITNIIFALLYMAGGQNTLTSSSNSSPLYFSDYFFFSVQTFNTIGYGVLSPVSLYANIIVSVEATVSLFFVAIATGMAFARFSRGSARVLFSKNMCFSNHDGKPTFMLRAANQRRNHILQARVHIYLLRDEVTLEGTEMRRVYPLKLVRNETPSFILSWSIMHVVDEDSPLFGCTDFDSLRNTRTSFAVALNGIDETIGQVVHASYNYTFEDIMLDHKFVDIVKTNKEGKGRYLNLEDFHNTEFVGDKRTFISAV